LGGSGWWNRSVTPPIAVAAPARLLSSTTDSRAGSVATGGCRHAGFLHGRDPAVTPRGSVVNEHWAACHGRVVQAGGVLAR
jgi:hypothetical protein